MDFIERIFGVSPDGGNGSTEVLYLLAGAANRLDIQASVDLEGLKQLQAMLKKYEEILQMLS
jgi:hypothetical protein